MADDAYNFIKAIGYNKVDVLGFSIGGCVAQELLIHHPQIVRKAILAGIAPKGAESINQRNPEWNQSVQNIPVKQCKTILKFTKQAILPNFILNTTEQI